MERNGHLMKRRDVLAVRKVMKLGRSLAITLPARFCRNHGIVPGSVWVWLDRGYKLTGTRLQYYEQDEKLKGQKP